MRSSVGRHSSTDTTCLGSASVLVVHNRNRRTWLHDRLISGTCLIGRPDSTGGEAIVDFGGVGLILVPLWRPRLARKCAKGEPGGVCTSKPMWRGAIQSCFRGFVSEKNARLV